MTMTRRRRRISLAAGAIAVALALGAAFGLRFGYEHAPYEVVSEGEAFEIRRYAPRVVAEVVVASRDRRTATSDGFRILADYIFGNNIAVAPGSVSSEASTDTSQAISMTTPVDAIADDGRWRVRFTMPSRYTLANLPEPVDRRVKLMRLDGALMAASRFSGSPVDGAVDDRMRALLQAVAAEGLAVAADREPVYARYDPPWTPSFLKRNEILVELEMDG